MLLAYLSTESIIEAFNSITMFSVRWVLFMANRWMRITPYVLALAWSIVTVFPLLHDGFNYRQTQGDYCENCENLALKNFRLSKKVRNKFEVLFLLLGWLGSRATRLG